MTKRFGFLFDAGAEISYKMPSGGEFALNIFREDTSDSKEKFKRIRSMIDPDNTYASNWLPKEYSDKKVATLTTKAFEELIKETIENNRKTIVDRINSFDKLAKIVIKELNAGKEFNEQIDNIIYKDLNKYPTNISADQLLSFSSYLNSKELNGTDLFKNRYFGVLLEYYKKINDLNFSLNDQQYLQDIIKTILQLQIEAMSSEVSRNLEVNIFDVDRSAQGYYDELKNSSLYNKDIIIGTTNYSNLINEKIGSTNIVFLNGNIDEYYDPYLNTIGSEQELTDIEPHFIVPLLFTQSGTKPMTAISMSEKYVDYYRKLKNKDVICTIGFSFNPDDEHINGIIRTLINVDNKDLYVIKPRSEKDAKEESDDFAVELRVSNLQKIHVIFIDPSTRKDLKGKLWTDVLEAL